MAKIAVFADVQNIYYTTRDTFSRQFDYRKLMQQLAARGEIESAFAYAIDRGDSGQQKFQKALGHIGFTVKLKPYIQRHDGSAKGDWDVGITIDVLDAASEVDSIVLLSGDGDFALLLDEVATRHGVATVVYGVEALSAKALIDAAGEFVPIDASLLQ